MKKIAAILLLSVYLLSTTELHQLIRLPLLVEHFREHKKKDGHLSLFDFLSMHYSSNKSIDADHEEDMKLPFKSYDGCCSLNVIAAITHHFISVSRPEVCESKKFREFNDPFLSSPCVNGIWQPPKFI